MGTTPTHEQGQLHLQVYDLRREARLRQARDWFFRNYIAETIEDSRRIAPPGSENGALVMQVLSYWEHACALLNYGLLHEDLSSRPAASSSESGSGSSRSLGRFARSSRIRCSSGTSKRPRRASNRGAKAAFPVISLLCGK